MLNWNNKCMVILHTVFLFSSPYVWSEEIIIQSTTSTKNSGFYDFMMPKIKEATNLNIKVVAVGTGQAIENSMRCDGDVLLVHDKEAEIEFVRKGYGLIRYDLMFNDFVIVGPYFDKLNLDQSNDITDVLSRIYSSRATFLSRSDNSGTHNKERKLWEFTKLNPSNYSGEWYLETGLGMGSTLNIAAGKSAYTLTDRATWISFKNKTDLKILFEGDPKLFNQYGVVIINKNYCPNVNLQGAKKFVNWLISDDGQVAIETFKVNGERLFFRSH